MKIIANDDLVERLDYALLVEKLRVGFCEQYTVPLRHHHQYKNSSEESESTLLLMPAWRGDDYLGIKIVTVSPNNTQYNLPSINGTYLLFDAKTGVQIAQMDAKLLTNRRTAAASALASSYLSRKDSETLLMVGTGALAPCLIEAHATVRPIKNIIIWGRNFAKAKQLAERIELPNKNIQAVEELTTGIEQADIISCATLSDSPLVFGENLKEGQHIDLVGSFTPTMREADDLSIQRSTVYVDTKEGALKETGDIVIPIQNGILKETAIAGDLFDLCQKNVFARKHGKEITLFKSVGHALEDLVAAKLVVNSKNLLT